MFSNDSWRMMNAADQSPSPSSPSSWSRIQDKLFERALVAIPEEIPDRWEKIAAQVPGKSSLEVRRHYDDLVHDVAEIDSGHVELPLYDDESGGSGWASDSRLGQVSFSPRPRQSESERKKGVPWTEEEHRLFLIGLQRYGKGDWRSISRNAVVSRTPTQVASHAQKYFMRLTSGKKDKKRSSIHDITTVDSTSSLTHTITTNSTQNWMGDSLGSQLPYYDEGPSSFGFSM